MTVILAHYLDANSPICGHKDVQVLTSIERLFFYQVIDPKGVKGLGCIEQEERPVVESVASAS
jgi:hypothetical protein